MPDGLRVIRALMPSRERQAELDRAWRDEGLDEFSRLIKQRMRDHFRDMGFPADWLDSRERRAAVVPRLWDQIPPATGYLGFDW